MTEKEWDPIFKATKIRMNCVTSFDKYLHVLSFKAGQWHF